MYLTWLVELVSGLSCYCYCMRLQSKRSGQMVVEAKRKCTRHWASGPDRTRTDRSMDRPVDRSDRSSAISSGSTSRNQSGQTHKGPDRSDRPVGRTGPTGSAVHKQARRFCLWFPTVLSGKCRTGRADRSEDSPQFGGRHLAVSGAGFSTVALWNIPNRSGRPVGHCFDTAGFLPMRIWAKLLG